LAEDVIGEHGYFPSLSYGFILRICAIIFWGLNGVEDRTTISMAFGLGRARANLTPASQLRIVGPEGTTQ
jgi:hypothetical protein